MGGEIFKDSLSKLKVKPTQKYKNHISLESRENSQYSDININKYNTSLIWNIMSQRNIENNRNKKEHIDKLFSRKIILEKYLLALILNNDKNNNNYKDRDEKNKKLTPNLNRNITNGTENIKTIYKSKIKQTNKTKLILKDKETMNCLNQIFKYSKDSGNLINKDNIKIKIKTNTKGLNIFNTILIRYTKIKSFNIFDPGIKIKDLDNEASTINCKIILDDNNTEAFKNPTRYFLMDKEEVIFIGFNWNFNHICFRCGAIKHSNTSQCKHRCNKCFGNHDTNKCKIKTIICSWCGNQRGHMYDCITNDIRYLKSIQCPICGLFGHIGNNCNSLYLAISSLRTRNKLQKKLSY